MLKLEMPTLSWQTLLSNENQPGANLGQQI